jgi:pyruvate,orthophosphate dikinase
MGKVCVCGAAALEVDYQARTVTVDGRTFREGDWLSIDGTAGKVYAGRVKTAPSEIVAGLIEGDAAARRTEKFKSFQQLMKWCDAATRMTVRTNADTPEQTRNAISGAVGIGLCRTERVFEGDRIDAMRGDLAETLEARKALAKLLHTLRGLCRHLPGPEGVSGTIRFLDRRCRGFLPHTPEQRADLSKKSASVEKIRLQVQATSRFNPMLGLRGCRLGSTFRRYPRCKGARRLEAAAIVKRGIEGQRRRRSAGQAQEFDLRLRSSGGEGNAADESEAHHGGPMIESSTGARPPTRSRRRPSSSASGRTT